MTVLTPSELQQLTPSERRDWAFSRRTPALDARVAEIVAARTPTPVDTSPDTSPKQEPVGLVSTPQAGGLVSEPVGLVSTGLVSAPPKRTRHNPRAQQVAAGRARMAQLSPEQRLASARKAVQARWDRVRAKAKGQP